MRDHFFPALAVVASAALAGCAADAIDDNARAAQAEIQAHGGPDFAWLTSDGARAVASARVDALLAAPLAEDDAVRIALAYSPRLQAALFERAAQSAALTRSARLPNPIFDFERLAGGSPASLDITRTLTWPLAELLLQPARARAADAGQQRTRLQLAADVLRTAAEARRAWVEAVAAQESAAQAERGAAAAEAGAELARRLEATGAFSTLQRAREEADAGDAAADATRARHEARVARAAFEAALGLDAGQSRRLQLPDHLPEVPASAAEASPSSDTLATLVDTRLDVRLARAEADAADAAAGWARSGDNLAGLAAGVATRGQTGQPDQHGGELSVPLPVFDGGDAARAGARARAEAARQSATATAAAAAAQLRAATDDRRDGATLARRYQDELVPLQQRILGADLRRYNGMLASPFDLLADAREQARVVQRAISARRDYWLADAAWEAARAGFTDPATAAPMETK